LKIEVFYVPECPHHPATLRRLREILAADGVAAEIHEVAVRNAAMAKALRFCGSPTIRINGRDIAGESEEVGNFAVSCRLYQGAEQPGVPPAEMIRRAVREARATENP
jgi:glutaredoxin